MHPIGETQKPDSPRSGSTLSRMQRASLFVLVGALIGVLGILGWKLSRSGMSEEELRTVVLTTLQREAPASFLVTGTLDITSTIQTRSTKIFLPYLLNLDLGTTEVTLRVPGRVAYGFDVRKLEPSHIRMPEEGVVEVDLPGLSVFSVEPNLEEMEMRTEVGWARTHRRSGQRQEQRALAAVEEAFRAQAAEHIAGSQQPRINTAEALKAMLAPAFEAAGLDDPVFRFVFGPNLIMEGRHGK